jgi:glycosyltransferase involved in cell wall biosynthesis
MRTRPRIAYLTPNAILPPNRGGRIRTHHLWRAMAAFADVVPVIVGDTPPGHMRTLSRAAGARYFPRRSWRLPANATESGGRPSLPGLWEVVSETALPLDIWECLGDPESLVRHCLNPARVERLLRLLRRIRPDLVVLCDSAMGLLAAHVRALGIKVVVGPHNFDSALYATLATAAPTDHLRRWNDRAAQAFAAAEQLYAPHVDQLWVCSRTDANRFAESGVPPARIRVVPNVYDVGAPLPLPETGTDLVFVGQGGYYPNEDAIQRLFAISRKLDDKGVPHRMRIIGRIGSQLRAMARSSPSVDIVGEVPSIAPYLESACLAPVALTLGGGTRLKILEAMAAARPVLSTPIGIEGIEAENGVHAVVEPDLAAFPDRIQELLRDRPRAQRIAMAGWQFVRENYSHERLLELVGDALRDLGLNDNGPGDSCLARNIGARVLHETIQFNPYTRLLSWTLLVRLAASHDVVTAEFDVNGTAMPANAFATAREGPRGLAALEARAVLPADVPPERLAIILYAWGRPVLRHATPANIPQETAGLLALEAGGDGIDITGWVAGSAASFRPPPEAAPAATPLSLPNARLVTARYRSLSEPVSLSAANGVGQSFPNPAQWLGPHRASTARLRELANRHAGQAAWLIGNGPSVRTADLDRLEDRLTFCFNRFHLAHGTTRLRATYTLSGDKQMIEDFGQQIVDESGGTVFIAHEHAPDLLGDYIWLRQMPVFPPLFSRTPDRIISPGGSTPFVAMQVAYFMGVRKFYFYGADFSFRFARHQAGGDAFRIATGEGNHFIANYRSNRPWCPPSLLDIGSGFLAARMVMEAEGGFVRNVTRGGQLEIFERQDFESALADS